VSAAERFLVRNGRPLAEIVIDEKPQRSTRLAAHALRTYVEKISGARLGIVTEAVKVSSTIPIRRWDTSNCWTWS